MLYKFTAFLHLAEQVDSPSCNVGLPTIATALGIKQPGFNVKSASGPLKNIGLKTAEFDAVLPPLM
jgi:hypothetical protein